MDSPRPKIPAVGRSANAEAAKVFALLYAVAVLLHILWPPVFQPSPAVVSPPTWLLSGLVLAAVAVIHRPASVGRLLSLAAVQILDVAYSLPFVPNHWLLTGILSLAILIAAAVVSLGAGLTAVQLGELYQTLTPAVRYSSVIFYFFTFFHKLNNDFLNPSVSCAVRFFEETLSPLGLSALPGAGQAIIFGTLAAELALAVGLALPRWQKPACLLGAGFHMLLALDAPHIFYNFSAVMFAVLWVCLPASTAAAWTERGAGGLFGRFHFLGIYTLIVGLCWWFPAQAWRVGAFGFSGLWFGFAITLLSRAGILGRQNLFLLARTSRRSSALPLPVQQSQGRRYAAVLLLLPALVLLNGLSPYLGLKTRTAWQMYSNLNLSPYDSNHYFIPYSLDVGGFMADAVRLTATTDPALERQYMRTGQLITWHELRRYVAQHPDIWVAYTRTGRPPKAFGPAAEDAALKAPGLGVVGKLLIFRPLGPQAGAICDW